MDIKEHRKFIDQIFPEGGEIWVKVKITNQKIAMRNLSLPRSGSKESDKLINKLGFESLAVNVLPQNKEEVDNRRKNMHQFVDSMFDDLNGTIESLRDNPNKENS